MIRKGLSWICAGFLALALVCAGAFPSFADSQTAQNVTTCPSGTAITAPFAYMTVNQYGQLCVIGTFSSAATAPYSATSKGYQQISVSGTAVGFTPPSGATYCYITPETAAIRYRTDGTNPTASVGYPLATGAQLLLSTALSTTKFIAQTGTSTVDIDCYA